MWSKTLKGLNERLADSLKGRVRYHYEDIRRNEYWARQFDIFVDKNKWTTASNGKYCRARYYGKGKDIVNREDYNDITPGYYRAYLIDQDVFNQTGVGDVDYVFAVIHEYLNEVDMKTEFKKIVEYKRYLLTVFGILDRRVGKRTFKWLYERINTLPEWLHKFIYLRIESEQWDDIIVETS